jgi:periplasmic divalent cation tolerance protein
VVVLTTLGVDEDAAAMARMLVDERFAACVNVVPGLTSVYRWKGSVEQDEEQLLLIKTTADLIEPLKARLHAIHPYELPEFLVLPVSGSSDAYLRWVGESVSPR